jgi:uncharacterized tellurite resistance protein B-like protein
VISTLRQFLDRHAFIPEENREDNERALRLATATLLIEVANADDEISETERAVIRVIVSEKFGIKPEEAMALSEQAEQDKEQVTSLFPFTRLITAECSMEDRIGIVSMLWQVTVADDCIDAHEEHLVRKIADLLYVPHSQFIRTRLQHDN